MAATRTRKRNLTVRMSDAGLHTLRTVATEAGVSQAALIEKLVAEAGRQLAYDQEYESAVKAGVPRLYEDMASIADANLSMPPMDFGGEPEWDTPEHDLWMAERARARARA